MVPLAVACSIAAAQTADDQSPTLPPFPRDENLVRVQVEGVTNFEYFVDLESVSVGTDGVVRYTLVARSDGGATNVAYEGIRCEGRERKLYAIGRADKTWSAARSPKWAPISGLPINRLEATLNDGYFCPARIMVRSTEEARKRLRSGLDSREDVYSR